MQHTHTRQQHTEHKHHRAPFRGTGGPRKSGDLPGLWVPGCCPGPKLDPKATHAQSSRGGSEGGGAPPPRAHNTQHTTKNTNQTIYNRGMTQAFFQMCEASKGVSDLFSNSGVEYKKFHGYAAPPENEQLDVDINSPELVRRRFARLSANFFRTILDCVRTWPTNCPP